MIFVSIVFGCIAILYIIKYRLLINNIHKAKDELEDIKQNPEENRILLFSSPEKSVEELLLSINEYILLSRNMQIATVNKERELRAQIENISHDLRTPLTSILGYLDLIDEKVLPLEEQENLEIVKRKAKYLQRLIGDFYDLSRLELNDYQINVEKFDITRFSKEILLSHFQEFENKRLKIDVNISEKPIYIIADQNAIERIFTNMIQNVFRYAQTFFEFSIAQEKNVIKIIFENDTSNMTQEDVAKIFERFYVKESVRTKQSTGLGLTINKLLIEAMGGKVTAKLDGDNLKIEYCLYENI